MISGDGKPLDGLMIRYTCPTCGRIVEVKSREEAPTRPFCSDRCQKIDLGKWLREEYVISDPIIPGEGEEEADQG